MRYFLIAITAVAAVAFVLSVAVEAKWIGSASSTPRSPAAQTSASRTPQRHVAATTTATAPTTHVTAYYFAAPNDVKVSPGGRVFVADTLNDRVVELGLHGTQFPSWGRHAVHSAHMKEPKRVLPLRSGFAVIDERNTRVALFSAGGALTANWTVAGTIGGLAGPTALALDASNAIYLADGNNDQILRLNAAGHVVKSWSTKGFLSSAQGGPNDPGFPGGLAIDRAGKVYVSYPNAGAVQKFSMSGTPIDKWTLPGSSAAATDVAVDRAGNVYVLDGDHATITKFSPAGPLLHTWGGRGTSPARLIAPTGITVDQQDHVFVSDAGNGKVGSFVKEWTSSGKFLRSYSYG